MMLHLIDIWTNEHIFDSSVDLCTNEPLILSCGNIEPNYQWQMATLPSIKNKSLGIATSKQVQPVAKSLPKKDCW